MVTENPVVADLSNVANSVIDIINPNTSGSPDNFTASETPPAANTASDGGSSVPKIPHINWQAIFAPALIVLGLFAGAWFLFKKVL